MWLDLAKIKTQSGSRSTTYLRVIILSEVNGSWHRERPCGRLAHVAMATEPGGRNQQLRGLQLPEEGDPRSLFFLQRGESQKGSETITPKCDIPCVKPPCNILLEWSSDACIPPVTESLLPTREKTAAPSLMKQITCLGHVAVVLIFWEWSEAWAL
ncbi:uncharacterized protein LOC143687770 isoform X2 [Tamandua tetradactyla]|uniref:uncharacterized protein LOC143687770 isoform X2 n=1 Tax=Tamandua tetradactyla TaxID=48850 RepID=UPI0040546C12